MSRGKGRRAAASLFHVTDGRRNVGIGVRAMKGFSRVRGMMAIARDDTAQGVVEFAILSTILLFLFQGTIDFARYVYYQTSVTSAARVGAEAAINHCPYASSNCGTVKTTTSDLLVMWRTSCEAASAVTLNPQFQSCSADGTTTFTPVCVTTCSPCTQDICVTPSDRASGTDVTVSVGYSFKPITPLMAPFFKNDRSCFTGDDPAVNHHTLCASFTGRIN